VPTRVEIIRKSKAPATEPLLDFAAPTQQTSEVKVVNEVYDPITDDAYSLNLNYKGRKYDMAISRNGEIIDPSYYNSKTLKDVDVEPSFFKFTSQDIKNIFLEIEGSTQQTGEVELKYSPVDMKGYGKSYKQEDISEGGKSIIFNPYKQGVKINEGVLTASIDDVDGKTFYPISVNLSNTPEYLDYKNKKDILDAERKRLIEAGEKGIEDMLRGEGASMSTAKKQLLDLLGKELGKKNSITPFKGGNISKPTDIENTYKIGDTQISANENNDVSSPPKGSPVSQSFLQFPSDEEMDDVDNFDDVDFEDVNMGFDPSEDLSKQDDGKPETKCKK
jgi:hypothetical protein